jgi:hypothetical protein
MARQLYQVLSWHSSVGRGSQSALGVEECPSIDGRINSLACRSASEPRADKHRSSQLAAIDRNDRRMLSHREISSRSKRLSACLARRRTGGRMPPVGEITEKTDEDSRSNRRPIELIGSPACQRSQISDRWAAE